MRTRFDTIYLMVLLLSFPGYPLIVAVANTGGIGSTVPSMIMRTLNVGLALALVFGYLSSRRDSSSTRLIWIFLLFWFAYIIRIFLDTIYYPVDLGKEASYYWIWAIGGSFIPMLGLALKPHRIEHTDDYFRWFYVMTLVAGVIALFSASGAGVDSTGHAAETGRLRIGNALNPIALGHLGAMLVVQSVWAIMFFRPWAASRSWKLLLLCGLCVGFYILVASNSRGPIIAALVCMITVLVCVPLRYKLAILLFLMLATAAVVPTALYLEESQNIVAFSRLFGSSLTEQAISSSRIELYASALDLFWSDPLTGGAMEDPHTFSYPHNVLIESFMAVGLFFGLLFTIGLLILTLRALSSFRKYPQFGWPSVLFLQYLIGAQFSGSLYNSTYLWAAAGLIMSFSRPKYAFGLAPNLAQAV